MLNMRSGPWDWINSLKAIKKIYETPLPIDIMLKSRKNNLNLWYWYITQQKGNWKQLRSTIMRRTQYLKDEIEKNLQKKRLGWWKLKLKKKYTKTIKKIIKHYFNE